jgi:hypothetical protein
VRATCWRFSIAAERFFIGFFDHLAEIRFIKKKKDYRNHTMVILDLADMVLADWSCYIVDPELREQNRHRE